MATEPRTTGAARVAPAFSPSVPKPHGPGSDFEIALADVAATMGQANAVLTIIANYGALAPDQADAIHGAATIVRAAITDLGAIEIDLRGEGR